MSGGAAAPAPAPDRTPDNTKGVYRVAGKRTVFGAAPGETISLDLPRGQIAALLESGNLVPAPAPVELPAPGPTVIRASDDASAADSN